MDKDYRSLEHKIRDVIEASMNRNTDIRRKVVNVGRPDTAESNFDDKSKLAKQGEIKTKIIDEAEKCNMTEAGTACPVHGLKECMAESKKVDEAKKADDKEDKEPKKDSDKKDDDKESKAGPAKAEDEFTGGKTDVDFDPKTNDKVVVDSEDKPKKTKKVTKEETMLKSDNKFGLPQDLIDTVAEALKGGQKKLDKNHNGKIDAQDFKLLKKEETEQLDEIGDTPAGKKALGSYINKAANKLHKSSFMIAKDKPENANKHGNDAYKRRVGIQQATSRLTKEEAEQIDETEQLDEISKKTAFSAYAGKANDDYSKDYGEKLHGMIKKKWGKKAGDDAESHASAQHFGRGGKSRGTDKLSGVWNTSSDKMRTTKSGKIHKQDTKAKASEIKSRLGTHKKAKLPEEIELENFIEYNLEEGYDINDIANFIEENYQLDELSKGTLASYINKAGDSRNAQGYAMAKGGTVADKKKINAKDVNRMSGISRATKRLAKEEVELSAEELARIEEIAKGL